MGCTSLGTLRRMDLTRVRDKAVFLFRHATGAASDEPGWAPDAVHGAVHVTPVHPDQPPRPYRVESPTLGVLELDLDSRTARTADLWATVHWSPKASRRSDSDARTTWPGHELHLHHTGNKRAELRLDGRRVARLRRTSHHLGQGTRFRVQYEVHWDHAVHPSVALLGHALASCFGVGAQSTVSRFAEELG